MLEDDFIQRILRQLEWAGRDVAGARALDAVRTGLEQGITAGTAREARLFAEAIVDPEGGKTGIRQFMDKVAPPLPVRRDGVWIDAEHEIRAQALEAAGDLLPVGAPFYPGVTPIPRHQYAFGIARDPDTGAPRFGPPASHEKELIVSVPEPAPNEALLYMLTSEVNFNDIWALTGIPVSPFDAHEEDVQITGSGGIALVAALGSETRAQGRIKVGDLVTVYSGTNDLLSPLVGNDPMYADFSIQGYETETGSHAQFLTVQAPQMHKVPPDLTLEQAGSYVLNLGTIARCLFTTLQIAPGRTLFVEGAATGTGLDALRSSVRTGLQVTGLVSSEERASFITKVQGAVVLAGNDVRMTGAMPVLEKLQGTVQFTETGFNLVGTQGRLLGGPIRIEGSMRPAAPGTASTDPPPAARLGTSAIGKAIGAVSTWPSACMPPRCRPARK